MNKIIDRYMFRTLSFGLLVAVLLFLSIDVLFNVIKEVKHISPSYTIGDVLFFVMLTIPTKTYELFQVSAVVAVVAGLGSLAAGSELVVLMASGVSKIRMAWTVVMTIGFWLVFVVLMGEYVSPAGEQMAQTYRSQKISDGQGISTASSVWLRDENIIFNARQMEQTPETGDNQMIDVTVFEMQDKKVSKVYKAEKATFVNNSWLLEKLQVSIFTDQGVKTEYFQEQTWKSRIKPEILNISTTRAKYLSVRDLKKFKEFSGKHNELNSAYEIAWWSKFSYPLLVLATALTGVLFLFGHARSGGFAQRLVIGVVLGVVIYLINKTLINVGEVYHVQPFIITVLPSLLILSFTIFLLRKV
ncbi:MAG: LPS export ABC transporter permease LptG [Proteobacteria bacterium]|nr:LPS export ABC transporter permease LptG [Pseudomonadota bacterium]